MATSRQKFVLRSIAFASALSFAGSLALFVTAIVISNRKTASGELIVQSILLFMLAAVLIAVWAARGASLRQVIAAVGTTASPGQRNEELKFPAPAVRLHKPRPWKHIAGMHRRVVAIYLALVCIVVAGLVVLSSDRSIDPGFVGTIIGLDFVGLVVLSVTAPARFFKPGDLDAIASFQPGSRVWISTTTAGMRAYGSQYFDSMASGDRHLKTGGYVALTGSDIQFWQRQRDELLLICAFSRDDISAVAKGDVTWTIVVQSGVVLTVESGDRRFQVPLLLANPRPGRKSPAVDEFLAAWAASNDRGPETIDDDGTAS